MPAFDQMNLANPGGANAPLSVQNVTLDTNTGPQANASDFGFDMQPLARGLNDLAGVGNSIVAERLQKTNNLWVQQAHAQSTEYWTQRLSDAQVNGERIDPAQFQSDYQDYIDKVAKTAPNDDAAYAVQSAMTDSGVRLFHRVMGMEVQNRLIDRANSMAAAMGSTVNTAQQTGDFNSALSAIDAIKGTATGIVPAPQITGAVADAKAQVYDGQTQQSIATKGYDQTAQDLEEGILNPNLSPDQRTGLAAQVRTDGQLKTVATQTVAKQGLMTLTQQIEDGKPVDPAAIGAARQSFIQSAALSKNPVALQREVTNAQNAFDSAIATSQFTASMGQKMLGMNPAQLSQAVTQLQGSLGQDNPAFQKTARMAQKMVAMIDPKGATYDPMAYSMKSPGVLQAKVAADAAFQQLSTLSQAGQDTTAAQADFNTKQQAFQTMSFALQRQAGVPIGQERLLPDANAKVLADQMNQPGQAQKIYQSLSAQYGPDNMGQVIGQLFDPTKDRKAYSSIQLAMMNPNNPDVWKAFQTAAPEKGDESMKAINQAIANDSTVSKQVGAQYGQTPGGVASAENLRSGIAQLAWYYHASPDPTGKPMMSTDAAVQKAIDQTINTANYFTKTGGNRQMLVPKGMVTNQDDADNLSNTMQVLAQKIASPANPMGLQVPDALKNLPDPFVGLRSSAFFQRTQGGYQLYTKAVDGSPIGVNAANGKPIFVPDAMAKQMPLDVNAAYTPEARRVTGKFTMQAMVADNYLNKIATLIHQPDNSVQPPAPAQIPQPPGSTPPLPQNDQGDGQLPSAQSGYAPATLTAYNNQEDSYGSQTAKPGLTGKNVATQGVTIAVDPKVIPFGSYVKIPGLEKYSAHGDGVFLAHDTGSDVVNKTASTKRGNSNPVIDVYTNGNPNVTNAQLGNSGNYKIVPKPAWAQ